MKSKLVRHLILTLAVILCLSLATPAFAASWYKRCEKCEGGYDPETRTTVLMCADPEDGEWGSEDCDVFCKEGSIEPPLIVSCKCVDYYRMCLVIKVTPGKI